MRLRDLAIAVALAVSPAVFPERARAETAPLLTGEHERLLSPSRRIIIHCPRASMRFERRMEKCICRSAKSHAFSSSEYR